MSFFPPPWVAFFFIRLFNLQPATPPASQSQGSGHLLKGDTAAVDVCRSSAAGGGWYPMAEAREGAMPERWEEPREGPMPWPHEMR